VVTDIFVDEDDLVIDGGREGVRLCEEVVFRVVFDRANKGCLLARW